MSARPSCQRCRAILSVYRTQSEPEGLCAACAAAEAPGGGWRVLEPEDLVLAVAGVLAISAAERSGERVHVQTALKARGILADSVDVQLAAEKRRRRFGWQWPPSRGDRGTGWQHGRSFSGGPAADPTPAGRTKVVRVRCKKRRLPVF